MASKKRFLIGAFALFFICFLTIISASTASIAPTVENLIKIAYINGFMAALDLDHETVLKI